ncbi:hypothetical protein M0534_01735 [Methylonatrum kenyense]|uniref:hypothetical protein n=1 Tax=Methylonatrum kenyense TaxID=455253 RepID=UPI0020BEF39D|nr:hypothetical protein [Methylonatrum kenyense]MCK8515053.1 hypothetical protein [Methylonatrum kenyense]
MARLLLSLIVIAGIAYTAIHFYYGYAVEQALIERLDSLGLEAVEISGIDFELLAPVSTEATVTADVTYGGAEASITVRVNGHPLFTDDMQLNIDGLRSLRLNLGAD